MSEQIYLRKQSELASRIESQLRDPSNNRWSEQEIYRSINTAIDLWSERVRVPFLYTISGGWIAGTYEYTLPDYVTPPLDVQTQRLLPKYIGSGLTAFDDTTYTWVPIAGWELEPDATGTRILRLAFSPDSLDGRIIFYAPNSRIPEVLPTLDANITSSETSLTLSTTPVIDRVGYIRINSEWIQYSGFTEASSKYTLTNLVRGLQGTTAASHTAGDTIEWGIASHRQDLFAQLENQTMAELYGLYLTDASPAEAEHMQFQMRYKQQQADVFWRNYAPQRSGRFVLTRQSVGEIW